MIVYTIRRAIADPLIAGLGAVTVLFILDLLFWGSLEVRSGLLFADIHGMDVRSSYLLLQMGFMILLITMLGLSKVFIDLIHSGNIALILSGPVSRDEFILKIIFGILFMALAYTAALIVLLAIVMLIKAGSVGWAFVGALSYLPISVLAIGLVIVFLSLLFESYSVSVFFTFVYTFVIGPFLLDGELLKTAFGIHDPFVLESLEVVKVILPDTYGAMHLMNAAYTQGPEVLGVLKIVASMILVTLGIFYLMRRKEF